MKRPRRRPNRSLVVALYVNAALLLAVLAVLLSRGGAGTGAAMAAPQGQPIAGGGGMFLMPAQFSVNSWGCYVMDIDAQTLCAYQYFPAQNQLRLTAARHFRFDRQLKAYNTWPLPAEVQHLIDVEKAGVRGKGGDNGDAPPAGPDGGDSAPAGGPATAPPTAPTSGSNTGSGEGPAAAPAPAATESKESKETVREQSYVPAPRPPRP